MEIVGLRASTVRRGVVAAPLAAAVHLVALGAAPVQLSAQGRADVEATVRAREIDFARTMADRDDRAFLTFLAEEAVFFDGRGAPIRGAAAIGAAWAPFFEGDEAPFSWRPDLVVALESGTLALSSGPVHDPSGTVIGRFNTIWRLDPDGVWRVVFDKGES